MASEFDTFASEFAAGSLMEHFGDSGDGEKPAVTYHQPNGDQVAVVAIVGTPEFSEEQNPDTGEIVRRERMTITATASALREAGIERIQYGSQIELENGGRWSVDLDTTKWGMVMVDLGLVRKPLVRKQEVRRAGI